MRWAILTGEYPPQPGGVSDYTQGIAEALSAAGDAVTVVAPAGRDCDRDTAVGKVQVHRLPRGFHYREFRRIEEILSASNCDRVLLQYVPQAFGWKGMNVPLARWVRRTLAARWPVDVMFHEVHFPISWFPVRYALLGRVTAFMARQLAAAADRIFVSVPAWGEIVHRLFPSAPAATWLPIPSNVPPQAGDDDVAAVRQRLGCDAPIVGHFGTYGKLITDLLTPSLERVVAERPDVCVLLLGRRSDDYRREFVAARPDLDDRVVAAGLLEDSSVAAHLRACDVLLQPYPDGVSSRRSSVMAGLACGAAVVTNWGVLSESLWKQGGVAIATLPDAEELADLCLRLLSDAERRRQIAREGNELYCESFSVEHTINKLRS